MRGAATGARRDAASGAFSAYRNKESDPKSLAADDVWALLEDKDGILWVGTFGGGLDRLDTRTGTIWHFTHSDTDASSLGDNVVTDPRAVETFELPLMPLDEQLPAFLEQVALVSDQDEWKEATPAATLITMHAVKGLIAAAVVICVVVSAGIAAVDRPLIWDVVRELISVVSNSVICVLLALTGIVKACKVPLESIKVPVAPRVYRPLQSAVLSQAWMVSVRFCPTSTCVTVDETWKWSSGRNAPTPITMGPTSHPM